MIIHITDVCNLECSHCGVSCNSVGSFMSENLFIKCLQYLILKNDRCVWINGGEPTLHPQLFYFIDISLKNNLKINLVTNGILEEKIFKLAEYSKEGKLGLFLSWDRFHKKPSQKVIDLFFKEEIPNLYLMTFAEENLIIAGRSKEGNAFCTFNCDSCFCLEYAIGVNGIVRKCCHPDSKKIFNILNNTAI